jgi:hypothetical protein
MYKNIILLSITAGLLITCFIVALHSIDKITARDCERGIKNACQYVNTNN